MSFVTRLAGYRIETPRDAIIRNLAAIYNTQRGCGSVLPDLGLGEYNTYLADASVLREELEALASRYEPRLTGPRVVLLGRDGDEAIHFALSGRVAGVHDEFRIGFDIKNHAVAIS